MGFVKMDDGRADHPKLLTAGLAARGLDECCIEWSSGHLTDGFVPTNMVIALAAAHGERNWKRLAGKLVEVGRWEIVEGGYQIHGYLEWQQSKAERNAARNALQQRVKRYRERVTDRERNADVTQPIEVRSKKLEAAASNSGTHDPAERDSAAALLDQTFNVLADRRIAASSKPIANVPAYRASVLRALPDDFAALLANVNLTDPCWTPETLADWLEPPLEKPSDSFTFLRDGIPPCDGCGGTGWIYDDKGDALGCGCREVRTA